MAQLCDHHGEGTRIMITFFCTPDNFLLNATKCSWKIVEINWSYGYYLPSDIISFGFWRPSKIKVGRDKSVQLSSVAQLCLTLCDPMNRSTPGLPVHHQLPEFTQTHVHWVSGAIQPPHPRPGTNQLNPHDDWRELSMNFSLQLVCFCFSVILSTQSLGSPC